MLASGPRLWGDGLSSLTGSCPLDAGDWQTCELSAYLPAGVHEARQPPGGLEKGVAAAHVRQSFSVRAEQVAQLTWQDEQ